MGKAAGVPKTKIITAVVIIVLVFTGVGIGYFLTQPTLKNTLILGTTDSVEDKIDPAVAYDMWGWNIIQSLSSGLVEYKAGAATGGPEDVVGALATSWTKSDDGLVWTFNLRQGVLYDDGTEFNATHVKFSFDRGLGIADGDGAWVGVGLVVDSVTEGLLHNVTVVSKYQVKFFLNQPFGPFLQMLTCQACYMVDPKYANSPPWNGNLSKEVGYVDGDARASHPLGLGPYRLTSWVRVAGKDSEIRLEANPNYWNATGGYPKTKYIIVKNYADSTTLGLAMLAGDIDIAFRHVTFPQMEYFKTKASLKLWSSPKGSIHYLVFQEKRAPFNEVDVRQAVAACINRTEIVSTVYFGNVEELYSMIPNGMQFHKDAFKDKGFGTQDYTKALTLLNAHGYSAAHKLNITMWYETSGHYLQSPEMALVVKGQLEGCGAIKVTLFGLDWPAYRAARRAETMDLYFYGWYPDYVEADDYIYPFYDASGVLWLHNHYNNTYMNDLVAWSRFNTTTAVRTTNYNLIQNLSVDDCPLVPLIYMGAYAVTKLTIYGIYMDVSVSWRHWLVYGTT